MIATIALAACAAACTSGPPLPDEGTIEACQLALGVAVPGDGSNLGSPNGWIEAAAKAVSSAKYIPLYNAALSLQQALIPFTKKSGMTSAEIVPYKAAAKAFNAACYKSHAYDDPRFKTT